jgi:alpha-amylase
VCLVTAGDDYGPAPDLDHLNPDLRNALKDWLKWLQTDLGYGAWRLDFVKGYGAKYVEEYVNTTVGADTFNVGEYWVDMQWNGSELERNQDAARQVCGIGLDDLEAAAQSAHAGNIAWGCLLS